MVAPLIVAAIIGAVGSYMAAQKQKSAATQAAASQTSGQAAGGGEMAPMTPAPLGDSAQQRSLESQDQPVQTATATPGADAGSGAIPAPQTLEMIGPPQRNAAEREAAYEPVGPPVPQDGERVQNNGMTSLEMAQLGMMLGSQLFKPGEAPRAPGLPNSSFQGMSPVFRRR